MPQTSTQMMTTSSSHFCLSYTTPVKVSFYLGNILTILLLPWNFQSFKDSCSVHFWPILTYPTRVYCSCTYRTVPIVIKVILLVTETVACAIYIPGIRYYVYTNIPQGSWLWSSPFLLHLMASIMMVGHRWTRLTWYDPPPGNSLSCFLLSCDYV